MENTNIRKFHAGREQEILTRPWAARPAAQGRVRIFFTEPAAQGRVRIFFQKRLPGAGFTFHAGIVLGLFTPAKIISFPYVLSTFSLWSWRRGSEMQGFKGFWQF